VFGKVLIVVAIATLLGAVLARQSTGAGREQRYVVRPGDTLWAIASARYAGDPREGVWRIERRNHLSGAAITPGERLVLPSG